MQLAAQKRSMVGLAFAASLLSWPALADTVSEWPHFRGPAHGRAVGSGTLPNPEALEVVWKKSLGSGYSGISVAQGKVVTLFTSGADDVLAAFAATDGNELWRLRLGEKYVGHDGSDDGPLSTPAIEAGVVYALAPRGALVAASLDSGMELWRTQLDASNATVPFYGFTASPLLVKDLVVLPTGGEQHAVSAFDKKTGKIRWTSESGGVEYQSAASFQLAGQDQVVVATNQWLAGLEPATGKLLWKHVFATGEVNQGSAHVTPAGGDRLVLHLEEASIGLDIVKEGASLVAKEAFRSQAFANTLGLPVFHEGALYGFTGRFLTALDAQSGQILWRSRPPGGRSAILVDGKLAMLDPAGEFVLAEANKQEYRELARVKTLEDGGWAPPAFAGGTFFVRNLREIAAVRPGKPAVGAPVKAEVPPQELRGEFGAFLAKVKAAPAADKQKLVDAYFANVKTTPILEKGLAHFVYRGKVGDVGLAGTFLPENEPDRPLEPVAGTDLYFRTEALDNEGLWRYTLLVDYGEQQPDPSNPVVIQEPFNRGSLLKMPGAPSLDHLADPAEGAPRGTLDTFTWRSETAGNSRRINVYLPPGYDAGENRYPVLVVNHGDRALATGAYRNTLDNLIGQKKVEPLIALFVPRAVGLEYGGPASEKYVKLLTDELLPHLDHHYRTDPKRRAAIGVGSAGLISTYTALKSPGLFEKVAVQSFYMNGPIREEIVQLLDAKKGGTAFIVELSRQDYDMPSAQIVAAPDTRLLVDKLKAGGATVKELSTAGEAGWARWRAQSPALLAELFPFR